MQGIVLIYDDVVSKHRAITWVGPDPYHVIPHGYLSRQLHCRRCCERGGNGQTIVDEKRCVALCRVGTREATSEGHVFQETADSGTRVSAVLARSPRSGALLRRTAE